MDFGCMWPVGIATGHWQSTCTALTEGICKESVKESYQQAAPPLPPEHSCLAAGLLGYWDTDCMVIDGTIDSWMFL